MTSKVDICNLALTRLGANTITALSDNTKNARACDTLYDSVAKDTMLKGSWTACVRRAELTKTEVTPAFEFSSQFILPTNPAYLQALEINSEDLGTIEHAVEGNYLLTNTDSVKLKYIAYLTSPNDYGENLRRAIVANLAAAIAYPVTGQMTVKREFERAAIMETMEALADDGKNGSPEQFKTTDLIKVR